MQDTIFERGMERSDQRARDRATAVEWARELLAEGNFVVLDSETTGLDSGSEAVQLGVVAPDGGILLGCLIKPQNPVPEDAYRVHGIGDQNLVLAATFPEIYPTLRALLNRRRVIVYNLAYDSGILLTARQRYGLPPFDARGWECAMLRYAAYVGEWNSYRGDYKWPKLPALSGLKAHGAVADCLSALEIIKRMAEG